ncbi:MAG TPA: hypothetical protein VHY80_11070 [Stellaceae bacterium]|nr:hypothetical protein [Stellaceae bacterium]
MTHGGEAYLAIILAVFLVYVATLFWSMISSGGGPNTEPRSTPKAH